MNVIKITILIFSLALLVSANVTYAEELHSEIHWQHLNLSSQQAQQIQVLEAQWNREYMEIQPVILQEQQKLTRMLFDSKSDPLEIMALQQTIARKKEQLRAAATTNYLHKRQLLNVGQQHGLEEMIQQVVSEKQRASGSVSQTDEMPDHVQYLIRRVRAIWTSPAGQ